MYRASLAAPDDFDGWRATARGFALAGVDPADIVWQVGGDDGDLFASDAPPPVAAEGTFGVPRAFHRSKSSSPLSMEYRR